MNFDDASWIDLIDSVKSAGAKKIVVTDFGDLFRNEQNYIDLLLGRKGIELESAGNNASIRRPSFSQQGFEVVRLFAQNYAPGSMKKIMHLIDSTPQETAASPFMPFSEGEVDKLSTRYKAELAELGRGKYSMVTLALRDRENDGAGLHAI